MVSDPFNGSRLYYDMILQNDIGLSLQNRLYSLSEPK